MRIAIIGGTFDPIHKGHIAMASHVLKKRYVDEVWFMVAKVTPLKERAMSSFDDRCSMCELALAPYRRMKVCTLEASLPGISYTIQTVEALKRKWKQHEFIWLIGSDQAMQLNKWKEIDRLVEQLTFYVFSRGVESTSCAYPHKKMNMQLMDVSSTEIRKGAKRWMLPKSVYRYIAEHYLYLEEALHHCMSERRYLHSKSVAQLCVELALVHGIDPKEAYIAGLLHDVCKEWSVPRLRTYMQELLPFKLKDHPAIWHGYVGAYYIRHAFGIFNCTIEQAIFHHVTGSTCSSLAMIVYISDKLDPSRGYDSTATIELCKRNLLKGFHIVKKQHEAYLHKGES